MKEMFATHHSTHHFMWPTCFHRSAFVLSFSSSYIKQWFYPMILIKVLFHSSQKESRCCSFFSWADWTGFAALNGTLTLTHFINCNCLYRPFHVNRLPWRRFISLFSCLCPSLVCNIMLQPNLNIWHCIYTSLFFSAHNQHALNITCFFFFI